MESGFADVGTRLLTPQTHFGALLARCALALKQHPYRKRASILPFARPLHLAALPADDFVSSSIVTPRALENC